MSAPAGGDELLGPFLVDIDNDNEELEDALAVARKAVHFLRGQFGVNVNDLKIFFTGHKGFNLEVCPKAIGLQGSVKEQIRGSADNLHHLIEALRSGKSWQTINQVSHRGTVIDQIYVNSYSGYRLKHPYIRLHRSFNRWITDDGTVKTRMKTGLSVDQLNTLTARELTTRSESLAS